MPRFLAATLVAFCLLVGPGRPATATNVVFELVANAPLAHLLRGGGVAVDAGGWAFPRYVDGDIGGERWAFAVSDGVRRVAVAKTRQVTVTIPLDDPSRAARLRLEVRPVAPGPLKVSLNGRALPPRTLVAGWQRVEWPLEPGALTAGENRVAFDFGRTGTVLGKKGAGALAWLALDAPSSSRLSAPAAAGGASEPAASESAPDFSSLAPGGGLRLPAGGGLAWYLFVPEGANLALTLAGAGGCSVDVQVRGRAGTPERRVALPADGAPTEVALDLAALRGDVATLAVSAGEGCSAATILGGGLALATDPPTWTRTAPPPKRVVLYIIDTLRADRLKPWNPATRVRTPTIDRLAAEGAVFLQAYSQGNESYVSHAAIFTGQFPRANGVYTPDVKLRPEQDLVSEVMKRAGLRTGGFSSNGYIDVRNGYKQGWDEYVNALVQHKPYKAPGLLAQARDWVGRQTGEPWFLYVGTVDTHVSYRAHDDILPIYDPGPYKGPFQKVCSGVELGRIKSGAMKITDRDKQRIIALYDNNVDWGDRHLGAFLEYLAGRGELDETMVVLTSDHGDEFWERGGCGHAHSLYEELVHVPILVWYPPLVAKGARITEGVDTIDLLPTLADAVGAPIPKAVQGESLLPLANGVGRGYPRPSMAERHGRQYAVRLDRYKVILSKDGRRLFDLATDPGERTDAAATSPRALRFVMDAAALLVAYETTWSKPRWGVPSNLKPGAGGR